MQIHRIRGRNLKDALLRARASHGERAVVLSHESAPGGGVTITVTQGEVRRSRGPAEGAPQPKQVARKPVRRTASGGDPPGIADLRARMGRTGCSAELIQRVVLGVLQSGMAGAYAIDSAARILGLQFPIAPSPRTQGRTAVIAFVGPTGVGKTTTLAKLAARLAGAGRRIALATWDSYRVAAADQLGAIADRLQLPFHAGRGTRDLSRTLVAGGSFEAVLLDTTGRSPKDARHIGGLARNLARAEFAHSVDTCLVLSAASSPSVLEQAGEAFARTRPSSLVVTKLDETDQVAPPLELAQRMALPLAFLCDGQEIGAHLHRPRPDILADLVLRGSIA